MAEGVGCHSQQGPVAVNMAPLLKMYIFTIPCSSLSRTPWASKLYLKGPIERNRIGIFRRTGQAGNLEGLLTAVHLKTLNREILQKSGQFRQMHRTFLLDTAYFCKEIRHRTRIFYQFCLQSRLSRGNIPLFWGPPCAFHQGKQKSARSVSHHFRSLPEGYTPGTSYVWKI